MQKFFFLSSTKRVKFGHILSFNEKLCKLLIGTVRCTLYMQTEEAITVGLFNVPSIISKRRLLVVRSSNKKGCQNGSDRNVVAAQTSSLTYSPPVISPVCCSPLSSELHRDFGYIGVRLQKVNT